LSSTTVDSVGEDTPRLVDGARACPPEDCGGFPGYHELVEVLADPTHVEYAERIEWLGGEWDPDAFDLAATNEIHVMYDPRATRQRRGRNLTTASVDRLLLLSNNR
jgi:hypothetical protein